MCLSKLVASLTYAVWRLQDYAGKPQVLGLPIVPADEDQRRKVAPSPEGKEVKLTSHQSGNDLWPFGIMPNHCIALNLAQFPSNGCFPFPLLKEPVEMLLPFAAVLQNPSPLRSNPALSSLSFWLLQISNSTDSDCTPKLFVLSSKVRSSIPALVSALRLREPASEGSRLRRC